LLGSLIAGSERFADDEIENVHERRVFMARCVLFAMLLSLFCATVAWPRRRQIDARRSSGVPICNEARGKVNSVVRGLTNKTYGSRVDRKPFDERRAHFAVCYHLLRVAFLTVQTYQRKVWSF
jgi:hypothetical protein